MNIYAKEGDKVVATKEGINSGYEHHKKTAKKHLEEGKVYTVDHTEVGGWHTNVYLKEIPNVAFNSVHFKDVMNKTEMPADVLERIKVNASNYSMAMDNRFYDESPPTEVIQKWAEKDFTAGATTEYLRHQEEVNGLVDALHGMIYNHSCQMAFDTVKDKNRYLKSVRTAKKLLSNYENKGGKR